VGIAIARKSEDSRQVAQLLVAFGGP